MALKPGTQLGPYEITAPLGAGGMGEVYRATDTKLRREVAIKVLPEDVAGDNERLARFEREAHVLASLNHPHIASIYGLEESGGVPCLVLELVEGETLADRLSSGALPLEEALEVARQIAFALEAAHERGIIHRDLKPANVKITPEGTVKVLDFGLAKAFEDDAAESTADASLSPTLTMSATRAGVILGTAAYMSPEQARGKRINKRTDIWAFGCVLYELLSGRRAFDGETVSDIIVRILEHEPDWQELPAGTPLKIRELLQRCLRRDQRDRLHDIADARIEIDEVLADPSGPSAQGSATQPRRRVVLPWTFVAALAVLAGLLGMRLLQLAPRHDTEWFAIVPPNSTSGIGLEPAVSPDGRTVVFRALNDAGVATLWVRAFGSASSRELPGTEGGYHPFWSPDGRSVGFHSLDTGKLYRVDIADGTVEVLADATQAFGGTWGSDGRILFAPTPFSGLYVVPATGGQATRVTQTESVGPFQAWPYFLPDGNHFLFVGGQTYVEARLFLGSLDPPRVQRVADIRSRAEYMDGRLLFGDGDTVLAQRLDVERAELLGEPVRVASGVGLRSGSNLNYAFSVSSTVLVSASGSENSEMQLVSLDRDGRRLEANTVSGEIYGFAVSPDQTMLAFERRDPASNTTKVWTADLSTGVPLLLTASGDEAGCPVWSPGGNRVLTTSWEGSFSVEGVVDGEIEQLACGKACDGWPIDWSADGKYVVIQVNDPVNGYDLWILPATGEGAARPLLQSEYNEYSAHVSGDGRWLAYDSDESGRFEVYVQSFPDLGRKVRVSLNGAMEPTWRRDGRELYFVREDGIFMVAKVTAGGSGLTISTPQKLFQTPESLPYTSRRQYAVLDNGERFIFNEVMPEHPPRSIAIIKNWQSLTEER
jgi:Tol biopolymer transport system component